MAASLPRSTRAPSVRRATVRAWGVIAALGTRLNGGALPLDLDPADRAELERTIFG